ncbi:MAG: zinc metallopeptidase [Lachnospiraceae bacterium]
MPYYYYWDPTYLLVIIGAVICLLASANVDATMSKYKKLRNARNMTGAEVAQRILEASGIYDVTVECLDSHSGDHYDPRTKTVRLSYDNYHYPTVTAAAVAAHECGHAVQDNEDYVPLRVRSTLVPVANFGSRFGIPVIILGMLLSFNSVLIQIGIWMFALGVLFQFVTLPVEFNASGRAMETISRIGILGSEEEKGAKKVLFAAALTYVAAAASSFLQLLRLVLISKNKD